jgi:dTDP-D-glucose 4,6-dehydratase
MGEPPTILNSQKAIELSQNYWTCQTKKIKVELNFSTLTTLENGIRKTAQWYLENKWI